MDTLKAKRILRNIQKIPHKKFVLHGSLRRSTTILPNRPSLDTFKNPRKAKGLCGKAVYATRLTCIAVLYATLPNHVHWKYSKTERCIRVLHEGPALPVYTGYVHVCRGKSFGRGGFITKSKHPAKVVKTFKVTPEVLLYLWDKKEIGFFSSL